MVSSGGARRSGSEGAARFFCRAYFDSSQQIPFVEPLPGGSMRRGPVTVWAVLVFLTMWSAGSAPAAGQDAPVRGGTVVAAIVSAPAHLNPALSTPGAPHAPSALLYNRRFGRHAR